jgi:hypothetical protein
MDIIVMVVTGITATMPIAITDIITTPIAITDITMTTMTIIPITAIRILLAGMGMATVMVMAMVVAMHPIMAWRYLSLAWDLPSVRTITGITIIATIGDAQFI